MWCVCLRVVCVGVRNLNGNKLNFNLRAPSKQKQKQNQWHAPTHSSLIVCDYVLGLGFICWLRIFWLWPGASISIVDFPLTHVRLFTILPNTTLTTYVANKNNFHHPHQSISNHISHVWRKIWRKSCRRQKLPISISKGWSCFPSWSCPPSSP
jgi:hypothetical protein